MSNQIEKIKELIKKEILNNEEKFKSLLEKPEFYSLETYGKFESTEYKNIKPKDFFQSEEWQGVVYQSLSQAISQSTIDKKRLFENLLNDFLDKDLKFFGDVNLLEDFKNDNTGLILEIFKSVKLELINHNLNGQLKIDMDLELFDDLFDEVLLELMSESNTLSLDNLYKNMNVNLLFNTDYKHDIYDTSFCLLDNQYLLIDDRLIDFFETLKIGKEDVEAYYQSKGYSLNLVNELLEEHDLWNYEKLEKINKDKHPKPLVSFNSIMENIDHKKIENIPVYAVSGNINDILNADFDKSGKHMSLDNLSFSLAMLQTTSNKSDSIKLVKITDLNPHNILKKGRIFSEDISSDINLKKSIQFSDDNIPAKQPKKKKDHGISIK